VLDEDGMRTLKEHQQVRRAVVVEVNDRPHALPGDRVKVLDEIDLIVEVSIGLATDKDAAVVVLANVRQPIKVARRKSWLLEKETPNRENGARGMKV
jgi:hypothetical protein